MRQICNMCALNRNTHAQYDTLTHKSKTSKLKQFKGQLLFRYVNAITAPAALHTGFQNKTNNICSPPPHLQSLKTKTYHTYSFSNHTENINLTILTSMCKLSMWCLQNIIQTQTKSIHQCRIIFLFVIIYALFLDLYSVGFLTYISSLCKVRFMRGNI